MQNLNEYHMIYYFIKFYDIYFWLGFILLAVQGFICEKLVNKLK